MTRNLRALGLALAAAFAAGAVAASGAQATEFFHSHKEKTVLTETGGPARLTIEGVVLECKVSHEEGLMEGVEHVGPLGTTYTTESVTVHPIYTECALGSNAVIARTHECHYKWFAETTETKAGKPMGNWEIKECSAAAPIEFEIPALGIIIVIENQVILHGASYISNKAPPTGEWNTNGTVTAGTEGNPGVAWKCIKGKAACIATFGVSEGNNTIGHAATYTNSSTINGFEYISGTTGGYKEGSQTGIWKGPTE